MPIKWNPFRPKPNAKPIINQAIEERNSALDEIYAMQNNKPVIKRKVKK